MNKTGKLSSYHLLPEMTVKDAVKYISESCKMPSIDVKSRCCGKELIDIIESFGNPSRSFKFKGCSKCFKKF